MTRAPRPVRGDTRRRLALVGLGLLVAIAVLGRWQPWSGDHDPTTSADQDPVAVTSSTTTTAPGSGGALAPLTGVPVAEKEAVGLLRPALVAKVDGAAEAMPQRCLQSADVVIEVRVEGISRYLAVWHSTPADTIGPIRSARTTDPDLLAMFGHPLFSYSGGNSGVLRDLHSADWFTDVSHDAVPGAYRRTRSTRPPHDLLADAPGLWERADRAPVPPVPLFAYRPSDASGEPSGAPGEPTPGVAVSVGSEAEFVWDADARGWRRWAFGRAHTSVRDGEAPDDDPAQLAPANVVVLQTEYVTSPADRQSPEAVSVGAGAAWVLSEGRMQPGVWVRGVRTEPWTLTGTDGAPMTLHPGTTWVVLADAPPQVLSDDHAAELLAEGRDTG